MLQLRCHSKLKKIVTCLVGLFTVLSLALYRRATNITPQCNCHMSFPSFCIVSVNFHKEREKSNSKPKSPSSCILCCFSLKPTQKRDFVTCNFSVGLQTVCYNPVHCGCLLLQCPRASSPAIQMQKGFWLWAPCSELQADFGLKIALSWIDLIV